MGLRGDVLLISSLLLGLASAVVEDPAWGELNPISFPSSEPESLPLDGLVSSLKQRLIKTEPKPEIELLSIQSAVHLRGGPCVEFVNGQCNACGKGNFVNSTFQCELCRPGTYQDQNYYTQPYCTQCPSQTRCNNAQCETSYTSAMYPGAPNKNACVYPLLLNSRATWIVTTIGSGIFLGALVVLYFIPKYYEEFATNTKWWGILCTMVIYIINDIAKYYWVIGLKQSDYSIVINHTVQTLDVLCFVLVGIYLLVFLWSFAQSLTLIPLIVALVCEFGHFVVNLILLISGLPTAPLYFYNDDTQRTSTEISVTPLTQYRQIDAILIVIVSALCMTHSLLAMRATRLRPQPDEAFRDLIK